MLTSSGASVFLRGSNARYRHVVPLPQVWSHATRRLIRRCARAVLRGGQSGSMKSIALCAAAMAFAATAAPAAVLYKSVAANGTVEFSDLVPEKGRNVERIRIRDTEPGDGPATIASGPSR